MSLIDRYIVRRFLLNFAILFMLLFVFAVSIDLILQLDEFVDAAEASIGEDGGFVSLMIALAGIVVHFHGPRVFQFYGYMVGLVSVGAMGFALAQMHRHKELVAVLASGVRLHRIAVPVICAAFALNLVQLLNQELVLPRLAPLLIRKHGDIGRSGVGAFEVLFTVDGRGNLLQSPSFDPDPAVNTLTYPTILERDEAGRTVRRITADLARWDEAAGGWRLTNGRAITPQSQFGGETTSLLVGQPIDMYRTDVTPQVLTMRRYRQYATMLSLRQIREMMSDVGGPGVVDTDALVRLWFARFTAVLINMLVLVITLPFFLLREPANLLRQSVLCAGAAIPAMLGALLGLAVDLPGIPPAAGVFLPALVLIPVAMFMVTLIKT
ncbi:MAG: LptF/LptG family permease [Planctomycetota bacterium]|nr:LptF/LptG family permease [Planctomycetota bacterium]